MFCFVGTVIEALRGAEDRSPCCRLRVIFCSLARIKGSQLRYAAGSQGQNHVSRFPFRRPPRPLTIPSPRKGRTRTALTFSLIFFSFYPAGQSFAGCHQSALRWCGSEVEDGQRSRHPENALAKFVPWMIAGVRRVAVRLKSDVDLT